MKYILKLSIGIFLLLGRQAQAQGTLYYDQQSTNLVEGIAPLNLLDQPMGQTFTPSLSLVGFVELNLYDAGSQPIGATVHVNLRSGSVTGALLGTSTSVAMSDGFFGIVRFIFGSPVVVVAGSQYFLQPEVELGDGWQSYVTDGSYLGGDQIRSGLPVTDRDLWFREGIVVPEPASIALWFAGTLAIIFARRKRIWKAE